MDAMDIVCPVTKYLVSVRVLHISDVYLPKLGGIEKQVSALVAKQEAGGLDVLVATATAGPEIPGVFRLTSKGLFGLPLNLRAISQIKKLIDSTKPDVMHLHVGVFSQFAWFSAIAASQKGVRVVATVHSIWGPLAKILYRALDRSANWSSKISVSAVSETAATSVAAVTNDYVMVTPNGVDLKDWPLQDLHPKSKLVLVTATRLAARKRVLPLLRVLQAVLRENSNVQLVIAGTGISEFLLRKYVRFWGLSEAVKFVGRLSQPELHRLYAQSDVFIQLSIKEAFGLAAIEARATGLPVIGRSGNGFVEFVEPGFDGQLFESDEEVARYLVRLCSDRGELQRLQSNARRPVEHSWELTLTRINDLYSISQDKD